MTMRVLAMAAAAAFLSFAAAGASAQGTGGLGDGLQQGCPDPTFGGKYAEELRRLPVPGDLGQYGACNDYGLWEGNSYAGYDNLPHGYWVYSYPVWIIYGRVGSPGAPPAPGADGPGPGPGAK